MSVTSRKKHCIFVSTQSCDFVCLLMWAFTQKFVNIGKVEAEVCQVLFSLYINVYIIFISLLIILQSFICKMCYLCFRLLLCLHARYRHGWKYCFQVVHFWLQLHEGYISKIPCRQCDRGQRERKDLNTRRAGENWTYKGGADHETQVKHIKVITGGNVNHKEERNLQNKKKIPLTTDSREEHKET